MHLMSPETGSLGRPHAGAATGLNEHLGLTGIMTPREGCAPLPHYRSCRESVLAVRMREDQKLGRKRERESVGCT